jgi:hypothetical protein
MELNELAMAVVAWANTAFMYHSKAALEFQPTNASNTSKHKITTHGYHGDGYRTMRFNCPIVENAVDASSQKYCSIKKRGQRVLQMAKVLHDFLDVMHELANTRALSEVPNDLHVEQLEQIFDGSREEIVQNHSQGKSWYAFLLFLLFLLFRGSGVCVTFSSNTYLI